MQCLQQRPTMASRAAAAARSQPQQLAKRGSLVVPRVSLMDVVKPITTSGQV